MTDLDSTEILTADESLTESSSTIDTKASLKILSGSDLNTYDINKETIIGRSNPSDIVIPAPSLSKQHAKITINNGQYFIIDLASSNKTFRNKIQLQPNICYALHNGDEIKFGDVICSFQTSIEPKVDMNLPTQTITDSYDDQEPIQPMKVWNKNNNDGNDVTPKQNGMNESLNKSSSSFAPTSSSIITNNDDDDDDDDNNNLIIGSTTLPATVPLIIESKDTNNDKQREMISSLQIEKNISNEQIKITEMDETSSSTNQSKIIDLSPIENIQQTDMEASESSKQNENSNEQMENLSPKPSIKSTEQLEDIDNITDDTISKESIQDINKQEFIKENPSDEQMDTDQTTESPSMVIDDKQQENTNEMEDEIASTTPNTDVMNVDETEKANIEVPTTVMEEEEEEEQPASDVKKSPTPSPMEPEKKIDESTPIGVSEEIPSSIADVEEESTAISTRGVARKNVRRARTRRGGGTTTRARVISTRLHGGRSHPILPPIIDNQGNNTTLEETVSTETEETPKKTNLTSEIKSKTPKKTGIMTPTEQSNQTNIPSNIRVSARIKERTSSGRNRQYPYTDDYVDLDDLEKQSKAHTTTTITTTTPGRKSNRGRSSTASQKRINLRQQPIDVAESSEPKDTKNVYEQIDTITENKEPISKTSPRKRKSTTPVIAVATKRSRPTIPQTVPTMRTRRQQPTTVEISPTVTKSNKRTTGGQQQQQQQQAATTITTPKRGRKSTKLTTTVEKSPEKSNPTTTDRPVRIALSSHLNFDQNHIDILRKIGFEIMDESCQVDALVVDRIRRTKKFFMCLARGAHILSPLWIETMIKENRYIPYDKYYLEDTNAETRYGFNLRESVRLAKQGPIFENYKFFCTKNTSPPYDDLKDIIEAAGGKLIDKINMNKPGKDIICVVAQIYKNEYEDLFKKSVPIVSEEFILSGISKQKLDFDSFSLFQNATTVKSNSGK
ncbi:unnamed protein product [Rotaria sordida]|uniref:Mediator of DNA damage checkpoint protein 1 n=1 Tax=Rotaria sordida TaxID=392033 RepID=A0A815KF77_9BILA|nr:unnamed protein product [Rotaria sordida]